MINEYLFSNSGLLKFVYTWVQYKWRIQKKKVKYYFKTTCRFINIPSLVIFDKKIKGEKRITGNSLSIENVWSLCQYANNYFQKPNIEQ